MTSEREPAVAEVVRANADFFRDNDRYQQMVSDLDTYKNIRGALDGVLAGTGRLLDVGNGGVFDYDTTLVREIVALDLFLDDANALSLFPSNATARQGDALALPEDLRDFDVVLCVMLLHHLTGDRPDDVEHKIRAALAGARRALRPGGRLVIVESCVPRWFHRFERMAFPALRRLAATERMEHPATLQLSVNRLQELVLEQFYIDSVAPIPTGRFLLQFGHKWPTALTPARPVMMVALPR